MAEESCRATSCAADRLIGGVGTTFHGCVVTVVTATNVIEIRDAAAAGEGTVLLSIPASTAVGTIYTMPAPIRCQTGLFVDHTGTGTVVVISGL